MNELEKARSALRYLDPSCAHDEWIRIGMAIKAAGLSFEDFHNWSKNARNYKNEKDCLTAWNSFDELGDITAATLFYKARERGWRDSENASYHSVKQNSITSKYKKEDNSKKESQETENPRALDIWNRCLLALETHGYITRKKGKPDGLRYYPSTEPLLTIAGINVANYLVVPCLSNRKLQTLQFIPPEGGKKLNLDGAEFHNGYFIVGQITKTIYICEGLSAAWPINKITGAASVICFGVSRMMRVAKTLRSQYPSANLVIVPDRGQENLASKIAKEVAATWIELPSEIPDGDDVGDYAKEHGYQALEELLHHQQSLSLDIIFSHELSNEYIPPDELVEGILTIGDSSIIYGDSNSGKTFFVIDMGCGIARGIDWMGRKTEPGLVIYLAAESPASVRRRLQAYQCYHGVRVPNFAIVQNPINLFDGDADTNAVIQTIKILEKQTGVKSVLIVGDTLARLSAGANENSGQDIGIVIKHVDIIRNETGAHFGLIHHSGKNAAAGARGWSGIRAAIDTEIEITASPKGRCAEITKQRDLSTKGQLIGFELDVITIGKTKWGSPATSCVVVSANVPQKAISKRTSEIGGAIVEYLRFSNSPIKKCDIPKHFDGQYTSGGVYRQISALREAGIVNEIAGYISLVRTDAN